MKINKINLKQLKIYSNSSETEVSVKSPNNSSINYNLKILDVSDSNLLATISLQLALKRKILSSKFSIWELENIS